MPPRIDLTNVRYGRLLVQGESSRRDSGGGLCWECLCDCGALCVVSGRRLRSDDAPSSCGCNEIEIIGDSASIKISRGAEEVLAWIDADLVTDATRWGWSLNGKAGYIRGSKDGTKIYLHQLALGGSKGGHIDHKDGNRLNCRRENLRHCTTAQNIRNSRVSRANTSGFKGVHQRKSTGRWQAYITVDRKRVHLGYFPTPREAALAYNQAAIERFGEFARLNEL